MTSRRVTKRVSSRRDTQRGAMQKRRDRLHRLFYEMTEDERDAKPVGPRSLGARKVMVDALIEAGSSKTAAELERLGRGRLGGTPLEKKIRQTIYGPSSEWERNLYGKKQPKLIWIAISARTGSSTRYIRLDDDDIEGSPSDGSPWLFEVGMGFSSAPKAIFAYGPDDAQEIAEGRWPWLFFDELDEEEAAEAEEDGADVFPHPKKRNVFVRRSDDVYYSGQPRMVRARLVGDRYAAILPPRGSNARPVVVEYES